MQQSTRRMPPSLDQGNTTRACFPVSAWGTPHPSQLLSLGRGIRGGRTSQNACPSVPRGLHRACRTRCVQEPALCSVFSLSIMIILEKIPSVEADSGGRGAPGGAHMGPGRRERQDKPSPQQTCVSPGDPAPKPPSPRARGLAALQDPGGGGSPP